MTYVPEIGGPVFKQISDMMRKLGADVAAVTGESEAHRSAQIEAVTLRAILEMIPVLAGHIDLLGVTVSGLVDVTTRPQDD